ncbi:hypothetical protein BJX96DRAFT_163655 [Aspergillus floccosus]
MDHDEDAIYTSARSCSNLLDHILERAKNESESPLLIEELRGRFNLWARYVSVFAAPRASLDARLDPYPDIKDMVIELLDMVHRNLQWESDKTPETNTKSGSATGSQSDETEIPDIARPGLSAATAAIDRLIVLGASIRRSGRQSHQSRVLAASGGQEDSLCRLLVRRRFPHAQKSLCDQIGTSIHIRGTLLQYLSKRNGKLAYQRDVSHDPAATIRGGEVGEMRDQETKVFHETNHGNQQEYTIVETLPSRVSPSKVSRSKRPTASIIRRGFTVQEAQETTSYYPPKPHPRPGENNITCTICSEPLEENELTEESWRAHVDRDLEPYICLSEECKEPLRFFVRKREWAEHMQTRHSMTWTQKVHTEKWYCGIGHSDALEFEEKVSFLAHLQAEHGETLSKSQLQGRARRNRTVAYRNPFICPLCDCVPEALVPYVSERPHKQLSEHIAQHLKSLAFLSLSYVQDSLDDVRGETKNTRDDGTSTDTRSFRDSQQLNDLEYFGDIPETMMTSDGKRRVDGLEFDNDGLPELGEPEDRSFLHKCDLNDSFAPVDRRLLCTEIHFGISSANT